jgi:hypothetical protein
MNLDVQIWLAERSRAIKMLFPVPVIHEIAEASKDAEKPEDLPYFTHIEAAYEVVDENEENLRKLKQAEGLEKRSKLEKQYINLKYAMCREIENEIAENVYAEFRWAWGKLKPALVAEGRHKKAINKNLTLSLKKAGFYDTQSIWAMFMERLENRLSMSLAQGMLTLAQIEVAYHQDKGEVFSIDPAEMVEAYKPDIGTLIGYIGDETREKVAAEVAKFYNTDGMTMGDLVEKLNTHFELPRARLIAMNETTALNSHVVSETMTRLGKNKWKWYTHQDEVVCTQSLQAPDGTTVNGCKALHGMEFDINQPMPPKGSHIGCRCFPLPQS